MSALVDRAIAEAGLAHVLPARRAGSIGADDAARLKDADLLVIGALADRVRQDEVGERVLVHAPPPASDDGAIVLPRSDDGATGLELLREIAVIRLTGPRAARIRVDWTRTGLELAQVALGFGANELCGYIASKSGLPLADGALLGVGKKSNRRSAKSVKEQELADLVRRAGRVPVFVPVEAPGTDDHAAQPAEEQPSLESP